MSDLSDLPRSGIIEVSKLIPSSEDETEMKNVFKVLIAK
jgi:hypothetical protein